MPGLRWRSGSRCNASAFLGEIWRGSIQALSRVGRARRRGALEPSAIMSRMKPRGAAASACASRSPATDRVPGAAHQGHIAGLDRGFYRVGAGRATSSPTRSFKPLLVFGDRGGDVFRRLLAAFDLQRSVAGIGGFAAATRVMKRVTPKYHPQGAKRMGNENTTPSRRSGPSAGSGLAVAGGTCRCMARPAFAITPGRDQEAGQDRDRHPGRQPALGLSSAAAASRGGHRRRYRRKLFGKAFLGVTVPSSWRSRCREPDPCPDRRDAATCCSRPWRCCPDRAKAVQFSKPYVANHHRAAGRRQGHGRGEDQCRYEVKLTIGGRARSSCAGHAKSPKNAPAGTNILRLRRGCGVGPGGDFRPGPGRRRQHLLHPVGWTRRNPACSSRSC